MKVFFHELTFSFISAPESFTTATKFGILCSKKYVLVIREWPKYPMVVGPPRISGIGQYEPQSQDY